MLESAPWMIVNGTLVATANAVVPATSALTSEGVFETMLVRSAAVLHLDMHLQRLEASCAALHIPRPAAVRPLIAELLAANAAYLTVDRALRLTVTPAATTLLVRPVRDLRRAGLNVWRLRGARLLPEHKSLAWFPMHTLHPAGGDVCFEGVWLDRDYVLEGNTSNLFAVIDGVVRTAPLGNILPGVTRARVLAALRQLGIDHVQRAFTWNELAHAPEAFATASTLPIAPVLCVEGASRMKDEGPVTRALRSMV